jgi:hypothetical protein
MAGERTDEVDAGAANRGRPAELAASGAVTGSGAGAGGGGAPEEIDADSANGATGNEQPRQLGRPNSGADASNHGGR